MRDFETRHLCELSAEQFWALRADLSYDQYIADFDKQARRRPLCSLPLCTPLLHSPPPPRHPRARRLALPWPARLVHRVRAHASRLDAPQVFQLCWLKEEADAEGHPCVEREVRLTFRENPVPKALRGMLKDPEFAFLVRARSPRRVRDTSERRPRHLRERSETRPRHLRERSARMELRVRRRRQARWRTHVWDEAHAMELFVTTLRARRNP